MTTAPSDTQPQDSAIDARAAWRSASDPENRGALAGLRVLDLSRVLAGPLAAQMLADQGAEVLKVEAPSGDETRGWGPPFVSEDSSAYYTGMNHSKDNLCLDLRTEAGRDVLGHLLDAADVVIENFKAGTLSRWGFDYESVLAERNPTLVYTRITGFGVDGPMAGAPGYDAVLQSFGGLMSINGYPDGNPLRVGVPIVDIVAANMAFSGTLLALLERERSGLGQLVDITLLDAVVSILHPHSANWTASGAVPQRTGDVHPTVVPYQVFDAADGQIFISAANDRQFASLTQILGMPELASDPRFTTNGQRHAHRAELIGILSEVVSARPRVELADLLDAAGVASSPVNTIDQALREPQVRHRGLFLDTEDYRGVGVPLSLSRSRSRPPRPAAARGEHTVAVLEAMGYAPAHIDALLNEGVLG
ncbi:CoA transferase [Gordonia pseudamarae]|jgi:crotonobetainyl-CoA:carnitine CoA-transferase CaiB-like acyl-CoA transferase|uniref:CoA transferase n=1 Tax=Gordonia pseudamarae TaxID=2831662 RepID=A0ABX6IMZ4_9ACTN|nr:MULTISPECIES: CaiB/BaiF CoA-transferase family protein [Gordonia]MBD0022206.1 CoA transferase [Gordonia sp. (in: high G+C Gram-positive bacteria)]QHN28221.1 CoA transferase [Gordonia pseudamarae]QHN37081.1 CoA transferase [Gordonia pseudamarae]